MINSDMDLPDKLTDLSLANGPNAMIERIIGSEDVFYRLEQRGAPELSDDEKRSILMDLYKNKPSLFMSRYCHYMAPEDCECFDMQDYEIAFYAKAINDRCKETKTRKSSKETVLRNKRYAEMQRLKNETDYFSNAKMREREPLLFDKMVGRFLPEEEQIYLRPVIENESLSGVFMQFEDSQMISDRRKEHLEKWNDVFKKCGSSTGEEAKMFGNLARHAVTREYANEDIEQMDGSSEEEEHEIKKGIPKEEQNGESMEQRWEKSSDDDGDEEQMKADFMDHMEQRFLRGEDTAFFDYSKVDDRPFSKEFEKMHNQDLEDAYFNDD